MKKQIVISFGFLVLILITLGYVYNFSFMNNRLSGTSSTKKSLNLRTSLSATFTSAPFAVVDSPEFDLADALVGSGDRHLEPIFADAWRRADDDAGRLRAVVDQIASLTDTSARTWHARLCGLLSQV